MSVFRWGGGTIYHLGDGTNYSGIIGKITNFYTIYGGDDVVLPTPELHKMTQIRSFSGCDLEFERSKSRKY